MAEQLQGGSRFNAARTPTLRDVAKIVFRHKRLLMTTLLVTFSAGVLYALLAPSYKAEMKILVRRGRIDPALTPTQTASPAFEHDDISEEEMNSELEMLHNDDILRSVVIGSGLAARSSWRSSFRNESREIKIEKAVERLAGTLNVQPVRKSRVITISYSSHEASLSAAVLRELADAYVKKHTEMRRPSGQQTFFESQMNNIVREKCYSGGTRASVVLAAEAYLHRWLSTYERCVDLFIAPSQFVKQKLIENGWTRSRIEVLPHFQSLALKQKPHPGMTAPILYFGRLSREKGITDLLHAMQSLPHIRLLIAGEGPQRSELEALARKLSLNNLAFLGRVEGRSGKIDRCFTIHCLSVARL